MSEWISVKDMIPNVLTSVLVCSLNDAWIEYCVAYYKNGRWVPDEGMLFARNGDGGAYIAIDSYITHWMPLPPPPQTKEQ